MSDVDEGDREGDTAYSGQKNPIRAHIEAAFEQLDYHRGYSISVEAAKSLGRAIEVLLTSFEALVASHEDLQERLETYISRSAPAMSAASMHVPIGGGDLFWKRQQERKQSERDAKIKAKMAELKRLDQADVQAFASFFEADHSTQLDHERPKVQRKRKKTVRRK